MAGRYIPSSRWDTKELPIPIDQMVQEYRMAKYPNKQLQILAEQCDTRVCRIAWIMDRCGLAVDPKKLPKKKTEESFDYASLWAESEDAAICDRIRQQMERMNEVEEMESELAKEFVRKDTPPEEIQENGCAEEAKRPSYIKPKKTYEPPEIKMVEPDDVVEIPGKPLAEVGDHGVYRIVGELWSIYLEKLRRRGVNLLGTAEVLKMQDLERIVHEIVEGM